MCSDPNNLGTKENQNRLVGCIKKWSHDNRRERERKSALVLEIGRERCREAYHLIPAVNSLALANEQIIISPRAGHLRIFSFLTHEKFNLYNFLSIYLTKKQVVLAVLAQKKDIFRAGHLIVLLY